MSDGLVKILDGNTFVVSDAHGDIEASLTDPTGLFSFDTRFLSQWVLTVNGAAAERALGRRPAVLRDALLPRARHRDRLHRREALGDPAARGRQRLPRGADDPQPRREAGRPRRPHRRGLRLRRPVRGQGRARRRRGRTTRSVERGRLRLGYERETFTRETLISASAPATARRERPDLQGAHRAPRRVVDRPGRRHRVRGRRHLRTAEVRARSATGSAEHGAEPGAVARRRRRDSSATGTRSGRPTGAASSTSPRCASRRPSPAGGACRRPACRGS